MKANRITAIRTFLPLALAISCSVCHPTGSTARTWKISQDGTGDWTSISVGASWAASGDTVLVAPGIYYEPTIRIHYISVFLISEAGPKETVIRLYPPAGYEDYSVIEIWYALAGCVRGFTISGARNGWADCGGGISIAASSVLISDNIITDNWCANGGGICCSGAGTAIIENNLIFLNEAFTDGGIHIGGANGTPIIRGNTIVANVGSVLAGGIGISSSSARPVIENNIIAYNLAPSGSGGGILSSAPDSQVVFRCNDVWSNGGGNYAGQISDRTGIDGNISLDPLFCGEYGSGNFYLQAGSPCAEENVPGLCGMIRMGRYPVNCTTGTSESSWGGIKRRF